MVCHGNICRSPMAEAVAAAMFEESGDAGDVTVESFGISGYHAGERADPGASAALRRHGWPVRDHSARRLSAADISAADLVLCADRSNLAEVLRLAPTEADRSKVELLRSYDEGSTPGDDEVPDPWGGGPATFDRSLVLIERACQGLVEQLAGTRR